MVPSRPFRLTGMAVALAALVLSGCMGAAEPRAGGSGPAGSEAPTPETGSILVQVVTSEFQPVAKALVELSGTSDRAVTGDEGSAVFNALEPGQYGVVAAKAGYRSVQLKGKLVDVRAGETTEVTLTLEPNLVATAETTYQRTFPMVGFIACTVQVYTLNPVTCGRQTVVADPNGKSHHVWTADSALAQTVISEVSWQPTVGAAPTHMSFISYRIRNCAGAQCTFGDAMFSARGLSPIYGVVREDPMKNLTRRLSPDNTYPRELYAETLAHCPIGSCYAAVVVQQSYRAWISVFYGEQAPEGWSILRQA